jgi:ribonuclease HI
MHSHIDERKFSFCSMNAGFPLDRLIVECYCGIFFPLCCRHQFYDGDLHGREDFLCHDFQLVFTDGACPNNGTVNAKAGLGITLGGGKYSWNIPVDDTIDRCNH